MRKMIRSFVTVAAAFVTASAFASTPSTASLEHANALASKPTVTDQEIARIAADIGSPAYSVVYDTQGPNFIEFGPGLVRLGDPVGETFGPAAQLPRGVYWNFSKQSVWIGDGVGAPTFEVAPNALVIVGADTANRAAAAEAGPSVTCGAGYYACCCQNSGGSSRTYTCIANGSPSNCARGAACTGGGPGSTSCSMAASAVVIDISDEGISTQ